MKRILITGASGMLGAMLVEKFKNEYNVFATGNSFFDKQHSQYMKFDLSSESYIKLFNWSSPDIIIHCGALTNGNYCEENPKKAFLINGYSMNKIVKHSKKNAKIIYVSTDAVFPSNTHMASEVESTSPESIYGKSKELGEKLLISSNKNYYIVRTTIVGKNINKSKQSFVDWIIKSSKTNDKITLFDDVIFTPISVYDLAIELDFLIKSDIQKGIYHISGKTILTKYHFAKKLLDSMNYSSKNILKGKISNFTTRAKRSNDQTLNCTFYMDKTKRDLPDIDRTINSINLNYYE